LIHPSFKILKFSGGDSYNVINMLGKLWNKIESMNLYLLEKKFVILPVLVEKSK